MRLGLEFDIEVPNIDETPLPSESVNDMVLRLSCSKAEKIGQVHPNALIIGADQVACLEDCILTKPGNKQNAVRQLQSMRGKTVIFQSGLCLYNAATRACISTVIPFAVSFREYSGEEIERYLDSDTPYDCAGSFRSEQMGIALVSKMQGEDPTALLGLPLIRLAEMLRNEGVIIP